MLYFLQKEKDYIILNPEKIIDNRGKVWQVKQNLKEKFLKI